MKIHWVLSLLLMLMATITFAQDEKRGDQAVEEQQESQKETQEEEEEEELTASEKFREIKRAVSKRQRTFRSRARRADGESELERLQQDLSADLSAMVDEVNGLVEAAEEDEFKIELLLWVVQNGDDDAVEKANETLLTNHIESKELSALVGQIAKTMPSPENEASLRRLIKESPHDSVKAAATMGIYSMMEPLEQLAQMDESKREEIGEMIGEEFIEKWTMDAIQAEKKSLIKSILDNYADVPSGNSTYGEIVEAQVFAMERLSIGSVAEDIVGEDLDGEEFRLSDYRGKVVVLDFWGDW